MARDSVVSSSHGGTSNADAIIARETVAREHVRDEYLDGLRRQLPNRTNTPIHTSIMTFHSPTMPSSSTPEIGVI